MIPPKNISGNSFRTPAEILLEGLAIIYAKLFRWIATGTLLGIYPEIAVRIYPIILPRIIPRIHPGIYSMVFLEIVSDFKIPSEIPTRIPSENLRGIKFASKIPLGIS